MRKLLSILFVVAAGAFVATLATAQPSPGFSKTAPISGTGSNGSPLKLDVCASGSGYQSNGTSWACAVYGDITSVGATASMGLTGGATSGAATLGLLTTCSDGQVLVSGASGTTWTCGAGGEIVTAGAGLTKTSTTIDVIGSSDFAVGADLLDMSTAVTLPGTLDVVGHTTGTTSTWTSTNGLSDVVIALSGDAAFGSSYALTVNNTSTCSGEGCSSNMYALRTQTGRVKFDEGVTASSTLAVSDDATFESGTCVINSAGITCGGTLLTPGADITSVVAGDGLTGGGTSGAVTLDVAVGTGLSVAANAVNLNLTGASCSAGSFMSALGSTGTGTCTAATSIVSGTTNTIAKFTSATAVGNSSVTDSGAAVSVAAAADFRALGTDATTVINLAGGNRDTYIRAGLFAGDIYIGDLNTGGVHIGASGNATDVVGALTVTESTTLGDAVGDVVNIVGQQTFFGGAGGPYFQANQINSGYSDNSATNLFINYTGYVGGTTQFRDLYVADGKTATIAHFTGSTKQVDFAGAITTAGNATLGDATTDSHQINGVTTIDEANDTDVLKWENPTYTLGLLGRATNGSFNSGGLELKADGTTKIYLSAASNEGSYFNTGATGALGIGDTTPDYLLDVAGTLGVDGNTNLGDASGDIVTVAGVLTASAASVQALFFTGKLGGAPTVASCGTSPTQPSTNSTNAGGNFTTGSATGTSCVLTFNGTAPATPICWVVLAAAGTGKSLIVPTTITTTTMTMTGQLANSTAYQYACIGTI